MEVALFNHRGVKKDRWEALNSF